MVIAFLAAPLELYALPLPTGSLSPAEGVFVCVGAAYLVRLLFRPEGLVRPGISDLPYAALLGVIAIGFAHATQPAPIVRVLLLWALFCLVYLPVQSFSPAEMRTVCKALTVGAGVLGAIGAAQYVATGGGGLYAGGAGASVRAVGTFGSEVGDSNYYAAFLQLGALPGVAMLIADPRRNLWLAPFLALAITGLAFSLSRGGMLGFATGILLLLVLWPRARWAVGVCATVLVALTIAGANPLLGSEAVEVVGERLASIGETGNTSTNRRPELFAAAAEMTVEHPFFGIGVNQFSEHSAQRGMTERGLPHETAHNVYLSLSAETGLLGLGAFLLFCGFVARRAVAAMSSRVAEDRTFAYGLAGALLGFAMQGMTVSLNRNNLLWVTFLVIAGLLVALGGRAAAAER